MADLRHHSFISVEDAVQGGYLLATYFMQIENGENILTRAADLAIGQTIGTWTEIPGLNAQMVARHCGKVASIFEVPPAELAYDLAPGRRSFIVQLAFPEVNFNAQLPLLLTTVMGNDISTSAQVKLLEITISPDLAEQLGGPQFGIEGIRQLTGVHDRPLILNVIKPCTGYTPKAALPWFRESARAGCDVIKDDELLSNMSFNQLEQRVELFHAAAQEVYQETGHRALYCANITDRADRMLENARRAIDLGVDLLMVTAIPSGFGALQALADLPGRKVPLLAHFAGFNSMTESRTSGFSSPLLLGKLNRLARADAISFPSPYSKYPQLYEKYKRTAQMMTLPLHQIKPSLPVPGGGIHPATAAQIVTDLGKDVMLTVGGAIQGHPGGVLAGVRALHAALEAAMQGIPLVEKAREVGELKTALETWG